LNYTIQSFFGFDDVERTVEQQTLDKDRLYFKYYNFMGGLNWNYGPEQQANLVEIW
jgi:hypothetical protein